MANSDWEKILRNPARFSGQDIELEGVITGSLIEQITPRQGIQTVISPHPTRSGLSLWVDDMDAKVLVFLPGRLRDAHIQSLQMVKNDGGCLYVGGRFEYKPGENGHIGRLDAIHYRNV